MLPPGALGFAGGHAVALKAYSGSSPVGVPVELESADLVTRGKYLTQAADCEVCHTTDGGQPFAGGRAFSTPFGVLYSPNITSDRDTGIGAWTDADFVTAVHQGIAKGGQDVYKRQGKAGCERRVLDGYAVVKLSEPPSSRRRIFF